MNQFRVLQVLLIGLVICLSTSCGGLQNIAKQMAEVQGVGDHFIDALTDHKWQDARILLTKSGQENWDEEKLTEYWNAFEMVHGPVEKRTVAGFRAFAGPQGQSVTYNYTVDGKKRAGGVVSMKLILAGGRWLVEEVDFQL